MNSFQKELILSSLKKDYLGGQENWIPELFRALDKNNIDSEPLALPIINLNLEKFIPAGQNSAFCQFYDVNKLMRSAIVFDLYIPSKKWVANFCANESKNGSYLQGAVSHSVRKSVETFMDEKAPNSTDLSFMKKEDGKIATVSTVLEDAVMAYLNAQGIVHPLDVIPSLREPHNTDDMLLAPENIETFVDQIKSANT